jgi:hypothetical protein
VHGVGVQLRCRLPYKSPSAAPFSSLLFFVSFKLRGDFVIRCLSPMRHLVCPPSVLSACKCTLRVVSASCHDGSPKDLSRTASPTAAIMRLQSVAISQYPTPRSGQHSQNWPQRHACRGEARRWRHLHDMFPPCRCPKKLNTLPPCMHASRPR